MWDDLVTIIVSCLITLLIISLYVMYRINEPLDLPKSTIEVPYETDRRLNLEDSVNPDILQKWSFILNKFETGDLLAVSYNSFRGRLVRIFTGSMWTHVGMIYRCHTDNTLYVIEAARYEDKSGVVVTPIEKWLDWNDDRIFAWMPHRGTLIQDQDVERVFNSVQHSEVDLFVGSWLRAMIKQKYKPQPEKKYFYCSELVIHFLQELNVVDKIYLPSGYPPKEILFGKLPLINGHSFEEPKLLTMKTM